MPKGDAGRNTLSATASGADVKYACAAGTNWSGAARTNSASSSGFPAPGQGTTARCAAPAVGMVSDVTPEATTLPDQSRIVWVNVPASAVGARLRTVATKAR